MKTRAAWMFICRRLNSLGALEWFTVLSLWLIAILLLTACAGPCHPSITPSAAAIPTKRQTTATFPDGVVESVGIQCKWSFQ